MLFVSVVSFAIRVAGTSTRKTCCCLAVGLGTAWILWLGGAIVTAQSSSATLSGRVVDSTGAVLAGAELTLVNVGKSVMRRASSDSSGSFVMAGLSPGRYAMTASMSGFTTTEVRDIVLNLDDRVAVRIELSVASLTEGVRVVADANRISTSPAVSTVVDRQFVANLPLNGRTFQPLLALVPGVVFATGEGQGQFSVNGQRTTANYFTVDGVAANVGLRTPLGLGESGAGESGAGQLPALTAIGGTQGLAAVDALEEFRVQTSSYAPEFGRTPGGQISIVTRSGTNAAVGSVSEFFRHDALDATDWFTNNRGLPKAKLRQHDFGGVLGGPVLRDRIFFFGSYEGLRLREPRTASLSLPTVESRRAAHAFLQPYLDGLPIPNGRVLSSTTAEFAAGYSVPSSLDSSSLRLDYNVRPGLTAFARGARTTSWRRERAAGCACVDISEQRNNLVTAGAAYVLSNRAVHDFRVNYTRNAGPFQAEPDNFGGAVPPPPTIFLPGNDPTNSYILFSVAGGGSWRWGTGADHEIQQFNVTDSLTFTSASHDWKLGLDFRRVDSLLGGRDLANESLIASLPRVAVYNAVSRGFDLRRVRFDQLSVYAQDTWTPLSRLTLTYGVRWEFVPTPTSTGGGSPATLDSFNALYEGQVGLAPQNTPLWETRHGNFAPRAGATYLISETPGAQLVARGGFGMFYDLGYGRVANAYRTYPFINARSVPNPALPLTSDVRYIPTQDDLITRPPSAFFVMDRELRLPRTYQWNVSIERALGARQTMTIGYVGAEGRQLLRSERYNVFFREWPGTRVPVDVNRNLGYSDYHALQLQFQRRLSRGVQTSASYTYGRSRDTSSSESSRSVSAERVPASVDFGDSDYDARHNVATALTWQIPSPGRQSIWQALGRDWGVSIMVRARSGLPLRIITNVPFPPDTEPVRPNVVPGQPFWLDDPQAPGGRRLNPSAFTVPPARTQGDLRRGEIRGFPVRQVDLSLVRDIRALRDIRLQFRVDVFNLFNVPNFAAPSTNLGSSAFGLAGLTLASEGLTSGSNPLYQIGGPRSLQLSVKLLF